MFKAYITNLGMYNEGTLCGEWVEFPIDEDKFEEVLNRIGIDEEHEEFFVTDYECPIEYDVGIKMGEYPSFDMLNGFAEQLASLDDDECFVLSALLYDGYQFDDAFQVIHDSKYELREETSMKDIAWNYVESVCPRDAEWMLPYFDCEMFARDIMLDGVYIEYLNRIVEVYD